MKLRKYFLPIDPFEVWALAVVFAAIVIYALAIVGESK